MERKRVNELFDILQKRASPSDLRILTLKVLGSGAHDNLPGNTHDEKCVSLLETVAQREIELTLLQELAHIRPDIDLSTFGIVVEPEYLPVKEPDSTPFIDFANRKTEWERVVLYPKGQYYLFDGPAGYGKTALLQKLEQEFEQRRWFCVYTSLETCPTWPEIAAHLAQELQVQCNVCADAYQSGVELGKVVVARRDAEAGLALLFDVDHAPSVNLQDILTGLLRDFVTGIWDALSKDSEFFRDTSVNYRVVLVGRYLATEIDHLNLPYKFDVVQLTPFDYQVVQDVCVNDNNLKDKLGDSQRRDEFAAHLLFYSGGHPRCMASTLHLFKECRLSPAEFFTRRRDAIEQIAYNEANWVRSSIERKWRSAFDALCMYRRFDSELVKQLIGLGVIWQGLGKDAHDVINDLLRFYLADWRVDSAYKHLSDDITRRLLMIRLRYDVAPGEFADKCRQARQFCLDRLSAPGELHHIWALEALFSYLQANVECIHQLADRQTLRQEFFDKELAIVFGLLAQEGEPRSECASFKRLLADDWEFRFTLNYYLRDAMYTDQMYQDLVRYVEQFPAAMASKEKVYVK